MSPFSKTEELLAMIEKKQISFVDLQFTDMIGVVKNVTIPASELTHAISNGIWFDGSAMEGYARVAESDMHLYPELSTFAILPWLTGDETTARLICDIFTPDNQPFQGDPRAVLKRQIEHAAQLGFQYNTGPELEFFLIKPHADGDLQPITPHDTASYFDAPTDRAAGFQRQTAATLAAFGIEVETMHHEVAMGQHEVDIRYANALETADSIVTARVALKVLAQMNGLHATFIPKPIRGVSGSGLHVHQSLSYNATSKNAFFDPGDPHGLSKIAKHFIAGQLQHARGMCAILAPLVNSYKRLAAGYEAPVAISWARINRSALIRVPRASHPETTRIELRCPDPSCNPYLAFTVMLAAGLDGIQRELAAPEASDENLYISDGQRKPPIFNLPTSLNQALRALEEDKVVCDALGPLVVDRFITAKRLEWEDYCLEVTAWELDKYLTHF